MEINAFQFEENVIWEDLGAGVQRKILGYDDKLMLVRVKFESGSVGNLHSHHHSQITYVEEGVFEMTIGEETRIIKKGDSYYVSPNVIHGVVCKEPGVLIDAFSPHREDFI